MQIFHKFYTNLFSGIRNSLPTSRVPERNLTANKVLWIITQENHLCTPTCHFFIIYKLSALLKTLISRAGRIRIIVAIFAQLKYTIP